MKHYVLSSGIHVAQEFGFDKPTGMILYYEEGTRNFTMLHESLYPPPNMCPKTKIANGLSSNLETFFKTMVYPNKTRIEISAEFLMKFKNKLNYELPAWLIDANGEKAECCFKATRGKWFIKPKCNLGNIFQITEPKTVYLYFRFQQNEFMMFEKKFHKIFKYGERRVIEHTTIILDSDSEKENEQAGSESDQRAQALLEEIVASHNARTAAQNVEDFIEPEVDQPAREINLAQLYAFDVKITAAMATTNQVFHFPKPTSRHVLRTNQTQIFIRDVDTGTVQKCHISTADRNKNEKYISRGWNEYKIHRGLKCGDVVSCNIEDPPRYMNVKVTPN
ncbi:hypothetical protein P8452_26128 [Trifolium repens]|nr:hypothetical protein P8452_26128 [Trifolium repens]